MSSIKLGKVIKDFESADENELSLKKGTIVQILEVIDRHWISVHYNGSIGSFPSNYLIECDNFRWPQQGTSQSKLFIAIDDFMKQENDDLTFSSGNVIEGINQVNNDWWSGRVIFDCKSNSAVNENIIGIFPSSHVYQLMQQDGSQRQSTNKLPSLVASSVAAERSIPSADRIIGKVLVDMKAEIENEIDLIKGSKVIIFGDWDDLYFHGECNGKVGIFPKNFVNVEDNTSTYLSDNFLGAVGGSQPPQQLDEDNSLPSYETALRLSNPSSASSSVQVSSNESGSVRHVQSHDSSSVGVHPYAVTLFPFQGEFANELTFKADVVVHLIQYIDNEWIEGELNGHHGIFPKSFVNIIVDIPGHQDANVISDEHVSEVTPEEEVFEYPVDTFARVIQDYNSDIEGDLNLRSDTIVTLIRRLGKDWIEAVDDEGNFGLAPLNFLEIITSSLADVETSSVLESPTSTSDEHNLPLLAPQVTIDAVDDDDLVNFDSQETSSKRPSTESGDHLLESSATNLDTSDASEFSLRNIIVHRSPPSRPPPPRPSLVTQGQPDEYQEEEVKKAPLPPPRSNSTVLTRTLSIASSSSAEEDSKRKKREKEGEQRSVILTELLQSEKDYLADLKVAWKAFEKARAANKSELIKLIGNLDEIISINSTLNSCLERAIRDNDTSTSIASSFLNISKSMSSAYSVYTKNYESVPTMWASLNTTPDDETRRLVMRINEVISMETNCFDVPSLLIKPVQRILKYPLLISELIKVAKDDEEKTQLENAMKVMIQMASDINEYKRRKDIISKYQATSSSRHGHNHKSVSDRLSDRLSKINIHSINKKASRLGYKITSTLGLNSDDHMKDEVFDTLVLKFKNVEKSIKIFVSDMKNLSEKYSAFNILCYNFIETLISLNNPKALSYKYILQIREIHEKILKENFNELSKNVDHHIIQVLGVLITKFDGPNMLICKRNDKLIDFQTTSKKYDKLSTSMSIYQNNPAAAPMSPADLSRHRQLKEELSLTEANYKALNDQLISDLPTLIKVSINVLSLTIQAYYKMFKLFLGKNASMILPLSQLPIIGTVDGKTMSDIKSTFHVKYNLICSDFFHEFILLPSSSLLGTTSQMKSGSSATKADASNLDRNSTLRSSSSSNGSEVTSSSAVPKKRPSIPFFGSFRSSGRATMTSKLNNQSDDKPVAGQGKSPTIGTMGRKTLFKDSSVKVPQTTNQIEAINATYPPDSIFMLTSDYQGFDVMDLNLNCGDIVGVIKRHNPMGNTSQWLVDDGLNKGFVPSKFLTLKVNVSMPTVPSQVMTTSLLSFDVPDGASVGSSKVSNPLVQEFDPLVSMSSPSGATNNDQTNNSAANLYVSLYPFNGSGVGTIPLRLGQVVKVLQMCDAEGNNEWWKVQDKNEPNLIGFVPSNYLTLFLNSCK